MASLIEAVDDLLKAWDVAIDSGSGSYVLWAEVNALKEAYNDSVDLKCDQKTFSVTRDNHWKNKGICKQTSMWVTQNKQITGFSKYSSRVEENPKAASPASPCVTIQTRMTHRKE